MTNRINTDALNESLIVASVRKNRTIVPENKPAEIVPNSGQNNQPAQPEQPKQVEQVEQPEQSAQVIPTVQSEQSVQVEQPKVEVIPVTAEPQKTVSEYPKEDGKRKRKSQDYENLFIRESNVTARLGKTVYIRKEFHDRILKIIQVIGANEVSLSSYIDNIIAHHFDTFQDDISQSYKNRISTDIF
jgi:hypothetical protein